MRFILRVLTTSLLLLHHTNNQQLSALLLFVPFTFAQVTNNNLALFPGLRVTSHTPKAASLVLSSLFTEIGPAPASTSRFAQIVGGITAFDEPNKKTFVSAVQGILGRAGFTIIAQINYDAWFPLFGVNTNGVGKGLILRRIIMANPLRLIANAAPFDIPAVMFLPVEIVIRELPGNGGTDIIYNKPSSMVTILEAGPANYTKILKEMVALDKLMADLTTLISKP